MREGASFGPYRVIRKLGAGGMGAVFLGEHTLIGRRAAIKVLLPELSSKRESVDRFFNEARATSSIPDPGIVQVFDFGFTPENVAYIVMELLEGEQLNVRLQRLGALTPGDALRITRQVAGSLAAAHAAGIVHRDLKPENVFVIRDPEAPGGERPKILDFGVAKLGDDRTDQLLTRTGAMLGTPVYMSPEQCNGAARVDHRADIYSLGCVLFHLLTGRPPFDLAGVGAIISAHLREPPPVPSTIVPAIPPELDELVLRSLAKSPDDRFASMIEMQQMCDLVLARLALVGASTLSIPSGAVPIILPHSRSDAARTTLSTSAGQSSVALPRRRFKLWALLAALAVGTGSMIAVLTSQRGRPAEPAAASAVTAPDAPRDEDAPAAAGEVAAPPSIAADAAVPDAAATATNGSDATAASAGSSAEHAGSSHPAAPAHKPPVAKPPVKPRPTRPRSQLYDDRN